MTTVSRVLVAIVAIVVSLSTSTQASPDSRTSLAQDPLGQDHQRVLQEAQPGGTNEPVVCASCIQKADICAYSLCSGRAGITCQQHTCSYPVQSENGSQLHIALCDGVFFNADGRVMQGCFTDGTNKTGQVCPEVWKPVCGADNTTYPSSCFAAAHQVDVASAGLCASSSSTPSNTTACRALWAPVCSSSNTTYSSSCTAKAAGVTDFVSGACETASPAGASNATLAAGKDKSPSPAAPGNTSGPSLTAILCPGIYQPVCGPGNVTYNNSCEATRELALNTTQGACHTSAAAALVDRALSTATLAFLASAAIWAALAVVV